MDVTNKTRVTRHVRGRGNKSRLVPGDEKRYKVIDKGSKSSSVGNNEIQRSNPSESMLAAPRSLGSCREQV